MKKFFLQNAIFHFLLFFPLFELDAVSIFTPHFWRYFCIFSALRVVNGFLAVLTCNLGIDGFVDIKRRLQDNIPMYFFVVFWTHLGIRVGTVVVEDANDTIIGGVQYLRMDLRHNNNRCKS